MTTEEVRAVGLGSEGSGARAGDKLTLVRGAKWVVGHREVRAVGLGQ